MRRSLTFRTAAIALSIAAAYGSSATAGAAAASPRSTAADMIQDEKGFSVHQVDAEAGLHPERPSADDQKVPTDDGHAYWLRSEPTLVGGIVDVGLVEASGGRQVWLRVSDIDAKLFHDFTSAHVGDWFAFVLNGRMIGEPIKIMMSVAGDRWELPETNQMAAYARCVSFENVKERSTRDVSPPASSCRLPL